jgi:uracil-DNA glycosylase
VTTPEILDTYSHVVGEEWAMVLDKEFQSKYMQTLKEKLECAYTFQTVYPAKKNIFKAYRSTPIQDTKVLILGQDPYHNGAATGLAFDVGDNTSINPSLRNILKEVNQSIPGGTQIKGGNLQPWADQGVMLLNTILTVDKGEPKSHANIGWEPFIAATLNALSWRAIAGQPLVVILWGREAQKYKHFFQSGNELVLTAPHPASEAYSGGTSGFFGCNHFVKANEYLARNGRDPIIW